VVHINLRRVCGTRERERDPAFPGREREEGGGGEEKEEEGLFSAEK